MTSFNKHSKHINPIALLFLFPPLFEPEPGLLLWVAELLDPGQEGGLVVVEQEHQGQERHGHREHGNVVLKGIQGWLIFIAIGVSV